MQPSFIRSMIRVPRYASIGMSVNWVWDTESKKIPHNPNVQCSESWWRGESDVNEKSGPRILNECLIRTCHWYSSTIFAHISHPKIDDSTFYFSLSLALSVPVCVFFPLCHSLFIQLFASGFLYTPKPFVDVRPHVYMDFRSFFLVEFSSLRLWYHICIATATAQFFCWFSFFGERVCAESVHWSRCVYKTKWKELFSILCCVYQAKKNKTSRLHYVLDVAIGKLCLFSLFAVAFFVVRLWKFPLSRVLWHSLSRHIKMRCTIQCNYIQAFCIIFLLFHLCVSV